MGRENGPYKADFPAGTTVRIASESVLRMFLCPAWEWHHPLEPWQLAHAGQAAIVESDSYYHGADELYVLRGIIHGRDKGIWHEGGLERV
jgi:hypothetical protein